MSGFKLEGGSARGGKMAELVRELRVYELQRKEAALRATMAHLGLSIEDLCSAERARVVLVHSIPPMPAFKVLRVSDGEVIPPRDRFAVELDGSPVWRGWWEWSANYSAQWHEEHLTEWMRELMVGHPSSSFATSSS